MLEDVCGSPLGAGQEVPRSNVKCMYCNKYVQLKCVLVILLECSYTSALLEVLELNFPFTRPVIPARKKIFNVSRTFIFSSKFLGLFPTV